jgi:hypothetical protein
MTSSEDVSNKDQVIMSTVPADDRATNPSVHANKFRRGRVVVYRFSVSTRLLLLDKEVLENRCWDRGLVLFVSGIQCKELSGEVLVGETRSLLLELEDRLRSDIPKGVAIGMIGGISIIEGEDSDNRLVRRHAFRIVDGTSED